MKEVSNPTPFYLKSILNPNNTGPCSYCAVPVVPLNFFLTPLISSPTDDIFCLHLELGYFGDSTYRCFYKKLGL